MKTFIIGNIKAEMHPNGFVKGFILKRELTVQECRHIMKAFLGINVATRKDMYSAEDYSDYNQELTKTVNNWLKEILMMHQLLTMHTTVLICHLAS